MFSCANFGKNVKAARLLQSLTLREVSELTGVSKTTLCDLENGNIKSTLCTVEKVVVALAIPIEKLFTEIDDKLLIGAGACILSARREKGLSLRDLSELTDISAAEISRIETGVRIDPAPQNLIAIAKYIGLNYLDLFVMCGYIVKADAKAWIEE